MRKKSQNFYRELYACLPFVVYYGQIRPDERETSVKKEFIVERQGRSFVLYAGLLDLAHQQGLRSIRTELIQAPSEANGRVAICSALVVLEREGLERTFTAVGDAAHNNVAPAMQNCLVRMAETRAKARALRDAVNVGVAAFEELSDDGAHDGAPERGHAVDGVRGLRLQRSGGQVSRSSAPARPAAIHPVASAHGEGRTSATAPAAGASAAPGAAITETQADAVRALCRRRGADPDSLAAEKFGAAGLPELTQAQASDLIKSLNERPRAAA
jgi:hypothetical protein